MPSPLAAAWPIRNTLTGRPRERGGKRSAIAEMAAGDNAASPRPTSSRAVNNSPKDSANPEASVAELQRVTPQITMSRRE